MSTDAKNDYPNITILVAARNEEKNILRCLQSLDELNYPTQYLDIRIGDDQSTDQTAAVIKDFIKNKPHFHYQFIAHKYPNLKGKANVLAVLSQEVNSDFLFYCDADIAVSSEWINAMLTLFLPQVGVVVGVTRMTSGSIFANFQSLEWTLALAAMRLFSMVHIPFTGMGNNMAVRTQAYKAVGGYETIGFSIVEDFALFQAIIEANHSFAQGFSPKLLSVSQPAQTLAELLRQRKRWVKGAMSAVWPIKLSFFVSALWLPLLVIGLILWPAVFLALGVIHYLLVTISCFIAVRLLKQHDLLATIPLFWVYFNLNNTCMLINYLWPSPTVWKGRTYN
ncbi:glycosyltransferase [Arundinibacter roseus]|nr:glycosyltransferase [Arundinibacter roseus]